MIVPYQATLKRIETLALFVLAYFFLHERKNVRSRLLATVLVSVGAALVALSASSP